MPSMTSPAESHNSAQIANTKVGLIPIRMPPSAGPAITAVCEAELEPAMARGSEIARNDVRQHRLQARLLESAPGADDESHRQEKSRRDRAAAVRRRQNGNRQCFDDLRDESDRAPVIAIRHMAGDHEQTDGRDELHEPDQPEMERAVGQFVHLPADRDDLDLLRNRRGDPHIEKAHVVRMAQQRDRRGGCLNHLRPLITGMIGLVPHPWVVGSFE